MKIATIGTSFITEWFLSAAAKIDNAEPIAVYSRNEQKGKDLASQYGIQKVYTDLDAMLKDDEIKCVYVASPNSLHYQHASAALKAGKHVICEKPFTSTTKELKELSELAKSKHLFLFEAIVTIHMPNYISLKEKLPELGDIKKRLAALDGEELSRALSAVKKLSKTMNAEDMTALTAEITALKNALATSGIEGGESSDGAVNVRLRELKEVASDKDTDGIILLKKIGELSAAIGYADEKEKESKERRGMGGRYSHTLKNKPYHHKNNSS